MASNYRKLGDVIKLVDERNTDGSITNLLGVSIDKHFMPSVANVIGTDLTKYKVVRKDRFACSLMQVSRDHKMPISRYAADEPSIISPAYVMFELVGDDVLSEYLELWTQRDEFDREADFYAVGGVRGNMTWDELQGMSLVVPPIERQREIIAQHKVINARIDALKQLNDKLEAQAQFLFDTLFGGESLVQKGGALGEIADINPARALRKGTVAKCYDMATLPTAGCTPFGGECKPYSGGMRFKNGDTIFARITPCLENGKAAYINYLEDDEIAFGSTEYIVLSPKPGLPSEFLYFLARNSRFVTFAVQHMNGSSGRQRVSGTDIATYPFAMPNAKDLSAFDRLAKPTVALMLLNSTEMMRLADLKAQMLTKLSSR